MGGQSARRAPVAGVRGGEMDMPVSRGLMAVLSVVMCLCGYGVHLWHDARQATAAAKLRLQHERQEAQRAQQRAAKLQMADATQQREQSKALRQAALTPLDRRREALRLQFSPWSGAHLAAEEAIKAGMHNPASYEHVSTTYADLGGGRGITVTTKFRGTNAFGAVMTNFAVAEVDESGRIAGLRIVAR